MRSRSSAPSFASRIDSPTTASRSQSVTSSSSRLTSSALFGAESPRHQALQHGALARDTFRMALRVAAGHRLAPPPLDGLVQSGRQYRYLLHRQQLLHARQVQIVAFTQPSQPSGDRVSQIVVVQVAGRVPKRRDEVGPLPRVLDPDDHRHHVAGHVRPAAVRDEVERPVTPGIQGSEFRGDHWRHAQRGRQVHQRRRRRWRGPPGTSVVHTMHNTGHGSPSRTAPCVRSSRTSSPPCTGVGPSQSWPNSGLRVGHRPWGR